MIPKKIHYCWFGKGEIPEEFGEYIKGWKEHMPDYELLRWDESNYDVGKCRYIKEAYDAGKWGFVSDFARIDILYNHGGIYLDTDVEVLKPFDDLLDLKGFIGLDARGLKGFEVQANSGSGMGFEEHSEVLRLFLDDYLGRKFVREDGSFDMTPCSNVQTTLLKNRYGMKMEDVRQDLEGVTVLPSEYLSPYNDRTGSIKMTENTHSIHHYAATWADEVEKYRAELRRRYCSRHSFFVAQIISTYLAYKKYYGFFGMWGKILKRSVRALKESGSNK